MIPSEQLNKLALNLFDDIDSAVVYIDKVETNGDIIKKTIDKNVIRVFVNTTNKSGVVNKVEIYDKDGDLVQFRDMEFMKDARYGYLTIVEIKLINEVIE